jgi:hypothetical protein
MSPVSSLLVSSLTLPEMVPNGVMLGDDVRLGAPLTLGDALGGAVRVGTLDEDGVEVDGTNPVGLFGYLPLVTARKKEWRKQVRQRSCCPSRSNLLPP